RDACKSLIRDLLSSNRSFRGIGLRWRARCSGFDGKFEVPDFIGVDLAQAILVAMLLEPVISIRRRDVHGLTSDVRGLIRCADPLARFYFAAIFDHRFIQKALLIPRAAPA